VKNNLEGGLFTMGIVVGMVGLVFFFLFGIPFISTMPQRRMLRELAQKWGGKVTLTLSGGARLVMTYKSYSISIEVLPGDAPGEEARPMFICIRLLRGFPVYALIMRKDSYSDGFRGRDMSELISKRVVTDVPNFDDDLDFYCLNESSFKSFLLNDKRKDEIRFLLTQDVLKIRFTPKDLLVLMEVDSGRGFFESDKIGEARFLTPVLDSIVQLAAM
jgi:hypothetical protein